jgi:transposase
MLRNCYIGSGVGVAAQWWYTTSLSDSDSKSRTSADFINHLRSIGNYIKKNKIKRFILVTDNATFHVSRKTKQFIEDQLHWLTVIFLPKRSPNLNPVETRLNRNLKKDVCANHNYGTEENMTNAVRRYLRCIGSC